MCGWNESRSLDTEGEPLAEGGKERRVQVDCACSEVALEKNRLIDRCQTHASLAQTLGNDVGRFRRAVPGWTFPLAGNAVDFSIALFSVIASPRVPWCSDLLINPSS